MPSPALNKASMIALLCSRASLLKVETQLDGDQETNDLGCLSTFFLFFSFHFKSVRNDTPDLYRKLLYTSVFSHFMCMPWLWTPTICAKTNPHNSQPYCLRYLSHDLSSFLQPLFSSLTRIIQITFFVHQPSLLGMTIVHSFLSFCNWLP